MPEDERAQIAAEEAANMERKKASETAPMFEVEDAGPGEPSNLGIGNDKAFPKRIMRRPRAST